MGGALPREAHEEDELAAHCAFVWEDNELPFEIPKLAALRLLRSVCPVPDEAEILVPDMVSLDEFTDICREFVQQAQANQRYLLQPTEGPVPDGQLDRGASLS